MTFHNDYAFFHSQEKRSTYVMERTALTIRKARTQHSVEPALEATALHPRASSWGFSARRPSQRSNDCLWFKVSPARMSGLLGHPGDQETSAPCSCLFGGLWAPRPRAWSIHSPKNMLALWGAQPHKYKEGSHKGLRVGQEMDQETVWGVAGPRYTCAVGITGGPGPACGRQGRGWAQGWAPGSREANAGTERRERTRPETGAESHSLWLFVEHEVLVSGGQGSCSSR